MRHGKFVTAVLVLGLIAGPAAAKTLKIGSMSPLTGPYAADGNDIKQGVEAAILPNTGIAGPVSFFG